MAQNVYPPLPILPILNFSDNPYVEIIEQPASGILRFRYESEIGGRSAGSIVGIHTTADNRTYPTIKVMNYQGPYAVIVSFVTKDGPPYWPHPHNLIGREECKRGVCSLRVDNADMTCRFTNLGIQCVKKKDVEKSLKIREAYKIDPFGTGFNHPGPIDLSVLRLCFQVFICGPDNSFSIPLQPVVSDPIYDKKATPDLTITKLSHYSAKVTGTEVILLCERVAKDDIQVWFYEEQDSRIIWEKQAIFKPTDVHKQVAISFKTPPYYNLNVREPVDVFVQLRKPSVYMRGEPREFQYLPIKRDPEGLASKRFKAEGGYLKRFFQDGALAGISFTKDNQMLFGVPRTSVQTNHQKKKLKPPVLTGSKRRDSFVPPSNSFAESSPSAIATSVSVTAVDPLTLNISDPSTFSQLTSVHEPAFVAPPYNQSQPTSLNMTPLPILQQMMHQPEISQINSANETSGYDLHGVEKDLVEELDNLGLDYDFPDVNASLPQNLSASMFDSFSSITDTDYQDTPSTNKN